MADSKFQKPKWPSNGQLKSWLPCYLKFLAASEVPIKAAGHAGSPLEHLAAIGFEAKANRLLIGFMERLPKTETKQFVRLALLGASISLDLPSTRNVNKFLTMAETRATSGKTTAKTLKSIQEFRDKNGLAETESDVDAEQQPLAQFGKTRQLYHAAAKQGDRKAALKVLTKMGKLIPEFDFFWIEAKLILSVIKGYQRLDEPAALLKYIRWIDKNGYDKDLKNGNLTAMGLQDIALNRAKTVIQKNLKELRTSDDPNVHFPVNEICEHLAFMIHLGEKATAKKQLDQTLKELPKWQGLAAGFATSGVFTLLAEVLVEFDQGELASEFLTAAVGVGKDERHAGFRKSAVKAATETATTGSTSEAIERARAIRSPTTRRKKLVPLLAKNGDWKELKKTLDEVQKAKEATALSLEVIYALPAGIWL